MSIKQSTLVAIRALILSDRITFKGNEVPNILSIIGELNAEIKSTPEEDDDSDTNNPS